MTRGAVLICIVLAAMSSITACGNDNAPPPHRPAAETGLKLGGDFSGSGPGTLVSASSLPTVDLRLSRITSLAARIVYESTSGIDGSATKVSGSVFVPKGDAPAGGWPVIALGHATTGVRNDCAPSLSPTLLAATDVVTGLVKLGYAVAMSDYQGLGVDGYYHPYLDAATEGYNLIDSVRAAHKLGSALSDRWVAVGGSQGAQAAWAANELSASYGNGGDLKMIGSVSYAPPADIDGFVDAAVAGDLTSEQKPALQLILASLAKEHPDLNLDDYRRGIVEEKWNDLLACEGAVTTDRAQIVNQISADDLRPSSPQAADTLRGYLRNAALPKTAAAAPMLVIYGGQDEFIPPAWTAKALDRACQLNDVIQIQLQPDKGHADLDIGSAFDWIKARFNGDPAPNDCESFIASRPSPEEGRA
jgi:pimeloyl-ACP methyl ester carboxylesterase